MSAHFDFDVPPFDTLSPAQQALLTELGVHYMQGYLIDKPRPLCDIGYQTES